MAGGVTAGSVGLCRVGDCPGQSEKWDTPQAEYSPPWEEASPLSYQARRLSHLYCHVWHQQGIRGRWKLARHRGRKRSSHLHCRRHPPSECGKVRDDLGLCNLHLQRILASHSPRPGPQSGLVACLLYALHYLREWIRSSVVKVINQVFRSRGTQGTSLCFRLGSVDQGDIVKCSLGSFCHSPIGNCSLLFVRLGTVVTIPWGVCEHG